MLGKNVIENYFKNNFMNDAISIYSLAGDVAVSKEKTALNILSKGLKLEKKLRESVNSKGLVRNILNIKDTITNKEKYLEEDICNIIIGTPEVLELANKKYFLGYPKDNISGYTTSSYQKNYDCFFMDYLDNVDIIDKKLIIGFYYENSNGEGYFQENRNYYSLLDIKQKNTFFTCLLEKMNNLDDINNLSVDKNSELLKYISSTIKNDEIDNNSKYLTTLEFIESQSLFKSRERVNKRDFINIINSNFKDYSLYIHGVDQSPKFSLVTVNHILRSNLQIDDEYGISGTCEPKGPVDEISNLEKALDYHYGDNNEKSYNIIILVPKVLDDIEMNRYFLGYSRNNTSGSFPKTMKDFNCLLSDIINEKDYVPKEFIFAYHVYGPNIEDQFYINNKHISLLSDELQRIFGTSFLHVKSKNLENNLNYFKLSNINEDLIYSLAHPIIHRDKFTSLETTALEYFETVDKEKVKKIR